MPARIRQRCTTGRTLAGHRHDHSAGAPHVPCADAATGASLTPSARRTPSKTLVTGDMVTASRLPEAQGRARPTVPGTALRGVGRPRPHGNSVRLVKAAQYLGAQHCQFGIARGKWSRRR